MGSSSWDQQLAVLWLVVNVVLVLYVGVRCTVMVFQACVLPTDHTVASPCSPTPLRCRRVRNQIDAHPIGHLSGRSLMGLLNLLLCIIMELCAYSNSNKGHVGHYH